MKQPLKRCLTIQNSQLRVTTLRDDCLSLGTTLTTDKEGRKCMHEAILCDEHEFPQKLAVHGSIFVQVSEKKNKLLLKLCIVRFSQR